MGHGYTSTLGEQVPASTWCDPRAKAQGGHRRVLGGQCQPLSDQKGCGPRAPASQTPVGLTGLGKDRLITPPFGGRREKEDFSLLFCALIFKVIRGVLIVLSQS